MGLLLKWDWNVKRSNCFIQQSCFHFGQNCFTNVLPGYSSSQRFYLLLWKKVQKYFNWRLQQIIFSNAAWGCCKKCEGTTFLNFRKRIIESQAALRSLSFWNKCTQRSANYFTFFTPPVKMSCSDFTPRKTAANKLENHPQQILRPFKWNPVAKNILCKPWLLRLNFPLSRNKKIEIPRQEHARYLKFVE